MRRLPGLVRTLVLGHPGAAGSTVVRLTTSADGVRDVVSTVMSVPPAVHDDPALLPGPDRVGQHRVLAYESRPA